MVVVVFVVVVVVVVVAVPTISGWWFGTLFIFPYTPG